MTCDVSTLTDARCIRGTSHRSLKAAGFSLDSGDSNLENVTSEACWKAWIWTYFLKWIGNLPDSPVRCQSAQQLMAGGQPYDFDRNSCVQILELGTFERGVCARKIWAQYAEKQSIWRRHPRFQDPLGTDSNTAIATLSTQMRLMIDLSAASTFPLRMSFVSTPRPREYEQSVRDKSGFLLPADQPITQFNGNCYQENRIKNRIKWIQMRPHSHPPSPFPIPFSDSFNQGVTSTSVSATDMLVASFLVFTPTLPGTQPAWWNAAVNRAAGEILKSSLPRWLLGEILF